MMAKSKLIIIITAIFLLFILWHFTAPTDQKVSITNEPFTEATLNRKGNNPAQVSSKINDATPLELTPKQQVNQSEIISCPEAQSDDNALSQAEIEQSMKRHEQAVLDLVNALKNSANDEEKLVATLLDKQATSQEKLEFLSSFLQERPTHKIAYYQLLNACIAASENTICSSTLFEGVTMADSENGMFWIAKAALKFKQNDPQSAIEALRVAGQKSFYSEYFYQSIALFEQTISSITTQSYSQNIFQAIGYVSAISANYGRLFEHCLEIEVERINVLDACFQLGKNMEKNSKSLILASLGAALVKEYHVKLHNNDAANISENQAAAQYQQSFNEDTYKVMALMEHDEDLMRLWLQLGIEHGESAALKQITQEAKWRSQDPNYQPCKVQVVQ